MASLASQLLTVSILALQRQLYHNRGLNLSHWNRTYDYIVVGAGTAGSIVAGRLSENASVTVLLIEAGPPMTLTNEIMQSYWFMNYDWGYLTVPQKHSSFGLNNRQIATYRGKIVGGSHSVNLGLYTRGNRRDFDSWESVYGATGWNAQSLFPYFLKTENNTDPAVVAANRPLHSTTGPLEISSTPNVDPIMRRWLAGVGQLGWPVHDFADIETQFGANILQQTQSRTNWTKQTTAAAYIEVNIGRPNLHVLVNSHVTKLLFSPSGASPPTVTGVEFVRQGVTHQVSASREVVLSAGAYNSPQILMLSGIGPREHLREVGIPSRVDLPVGSVLYDHPVVLNDFTVRNASDVTWSAGQYTNFNVANLYAFLAHADGPLRSEPVLETYVGTGINGDRNWPDAMIFLMFGQYASPAMDTLLSQYNQMQQNAWRQYFDPFVDNNQHIVLGTVQLRPRSIGSVRLRSASPFDAPLIDPNMFANPLDLEAMVATLETLFQIVESPVMSPYLAYSSQPLPGCAFCTDGRPLSRCTAYLRCLAQTVTVTMYHPTSSCRMGNSTSAEAVVNERLQVRGVRRLRVIDDSVLPRVINTNTNAVTMAIAERGADILRQDASIY